MAGRKLKISPNYFAGQEDPSQYFNKFELCAVINECTKQDKILSASIPKTYSIQFLYMWHSKSKGPIWSLLETEILRKIGEIVKKSKK